MEYSVLMDEQDEILITQYIDGNHTTLKILIDRYTDPLYNFIVRFVGRDSAPDVVQDVWIKVWKNIRKFDVARAHFKTWLFTIARNTVTDYLRKKKMAVFSDLDTEDHTFADTVEDEGTLPDKALEQLEDTKYLSFLLAQLPETYQAVLTLYYQEDMTFKEIGEVLGKPLNTVKSHHRRALEQLRTLIAPQ